MADITHATRAAAPLSWKAIDADERRHDDEVPASAAAYDDITDIAPLAPSFLRYPDDVEEDFEAPERRARLMARGTGWPDEAYSSTRYVVAISVFVIVAVVALIGVTFA